MTSHQVRIVQIFRVEREIMVTVDAPDMQTAIDIQAENEAPSVDDPGWQSSWTLESDAVTPR